MRNSKRLHTAQWHALVFVCLFVFPSSACLSLWFWSFSFPFLLYRLVNWFRMFILTLYLSVFLVCVYYMFICIQTEYTILKIYIYNKRGKKFARDSVILGPY